MFKGKTILITGASNGLRKELAHRFVQKGAHLALMARHPDKLTAVQRELRSIAAAGQQTETFSCDLTDRDKTEETVRNVIKTMGASGILISRAGILTEGCFEFYCAKRNHRLFCIRSFNL